MGTALVLAARMEAPPKAMVFEELAGLVHIALSAPGGVAMATLEAPQPLQLGPEVPFPLFAACAGLPSDAVLTGTHARQVVASVGLGFCIAEVAADALITATPDTATHPAGAGAGAVPEPAASPCWPMRGRVTASAPACSRRWPASQRTRRPAAPPARWRRCCCPARTCRSTG